MKQSEKEGKEGEKEPTSVDEMSDVTQDARSSDDSAHPRLVSTLVEPFSATRAVIKMCLFFDCSWVSRVEFSVCQQFSLAPYVVGGALLGRRAQIGRRGADRSPGPPGEGRSPCGRLSRCGLAGASPNPRRARRPDVIFFRHDVPYTGRHRRRRAHGDRTTVAHEFVGRAPSRSLPS